MGRLKTASLPAPRVGPVLPPPENMTADQFAAFMDDQE
jgi:hypothetical protein